ncbi:hypothetical protein [Duganella sp. Dugasp56]|uniref:hypothetical protein n=1 Tax=Duganella sp. Dugasp56 TaxID=3243046 RepID=UPI00159D56A7
MRRILFAVTPLLFISAVSAQQRADDPLGPLAACFKGSEFRVGSRDRLPATMKWRMVETAEGQAKISMADGYRLMIYSDGTAPAVNLKLERSEEGRLDEDRAAVVGQFRYLAARDEGKTVTYTEGELGTLEHLALRKAKLDSPGPASIETLIQKRTNTVATVYLLNNAPEKGMEWFDAFRTRFLAKLSGCIEKQ